MTDFTTYFADRAAQRATGDAGRVSTGLGLHTTPPDEFAKSRDLGKSLGVPPGVVEAAPELFQQRADQERANGLLGQAPATTAWLQDFENQQLARDDLMNATWWEKNSALFRQGEARAISSGHKWGRDASAAMETTLLGRGLARVQDATTPEGGLEAMSPIRRWAIETFGSPELVGATPEERQQMILDQELAPIAQMAEETLAELEGLAPMTYDEVEDFGSAIQFISENLFSSAPHMMATIASGGFSPMVSGHLMAAEVNEELVDQLPDLSVEERFKLAGSAGTVMAGLELFGLSKIIPVSPTQMAKDAIGGELVDKLTKEGISAAAARTLQAGLAEGSTELMQEGIIMAVTSYAGGEYTAAEVRHRLINAFAAGGGVGAGIRGGVETTGQTGALLRDAARWATGGQSQEVIAEIDTMATSSKLRDRAPDKFQDMLEAQGLGDSTIQVPASELNTFYQSQITDETLQHLGVERTDFEAALSIGGDVSVPVPNYATHFAGTDAAPIFSEHGRFDDNEMSVAEAQAYEQGVGEEIAQALEADMAANIEPEIDIRSNMEQQLRAAGRAPKAAAAEALVHSSFWETLAGRKGAAVDDLASRFGLEVRGMSDIPPGGATDGEAASDLTAVAAPSPDAGVVFNQEGARDVPIEVDMDDGATETMAAGEVMDALQTRRDDAQTLLDCLRYG